MARRKVDKKDKGGEVKADDGISEETIEMVQMLKEALVYFSKEEIYTTLVDCKMEADLVIDRLLSRGPYLSRDVDQGCSETITEQTSSQLADKAVLPVQAPKEKPDYNFSSATDLTFAPPGPQNLPSAASWQQHGATYLGQSQYRNTYIPPHRRLCSYRQLQQEPYRDPSGNSYTRMMQPYRDPSDNSYTRMRQPYRDPFGNSYTRMRQPYRDPSGNSYTRMRQPYRDPFGNSYKRRQRWLGPRDKRVIKINRLTFCLAITFLLCMATIGFFLLFLSA